MTEQQKMQQVRESNNLVSKVYDNMVVYYNQDNGMVFAENNAEICPCHIYNRDTFMVAYKYSGLASKVTNPDVIVRIITEMPEIKKKFVAWLQREDKTDVNCPVTYADVFANNLFEPDWSEDIEDDYEPEYEEDEPDEDEPQHECCHPQQQDLAKTIVGCIASCLASISDVLDIIDTELERKGC